MYWKCNLNQSWLSSPFLVYLRDWQSEISQVQPREDVEVVKEKGITFLFCFLNCFMFKWKMQINLSVSVFEPCGIPQLKYMSCARRRDSTLQLLHAGGGWGIREMAGLLHFSFWWGWCERDLKWGGRRRSWSWVYCCALSALHEVRGLFLALSALTIG